jgi:hypothetical protein
VAPAIPRYQSRTLQFVSRLDQIAAGPNRGIRVTADALDALGRTEEAKALRELSSRLLRSLSPHKSLMLIAVIALADRVGQRLARAPAPCPRSASLAEVHGQSALHGLIL